MTYLLDRFGYYFLAVGVLFMLVAWQLSSVTEVVYATTQDVTLQEVSIPTPALVEDPNVHPRLHGLDQWERPEGPAHVALQVGHLDAADAPDELDAIRQNTGAQYGTITETNAMQIIAQQTKELLEAEGVQVSILPVTVPPDFYADVFLSLHADGSTSSAPAGYKIASPRRDQTGQGALLVAQLEESYEKATGLVRDEKITRNMTGYYAFNWRKYDHSAHPMAVSAIIETGFLTNASDRAVIVDQPEKSAQGISDGVLTYLETNNLIVRSDDPSESDREV